MLTRAQFYALNALLLLVGTVIAVLGTVAVNSLPFPPLVSRVLHWLAIGIALTFSGGSMSYAAYRRNLGDPTAPPLRAPKARVSLLTRILAGLLGLPMLLSAPLIASEALTARDWELLAGATLIFLFAVVFVYVAITGKDPAGRLASRQSRGF